MKQTQIEIMTRMMREDIYFPETEENHKDMKELEREGYVRSGRFGPRNWLGYVLTQQGLETMTKIYHVRDA